MDPASGTKTARGDSPSGSGGEDAKRAGGCRHRAAKETAGRLAGGIREEASRGRLGPDPGGKARRGTDRSFAGPKETQSGTEKAGGPVSGRSEAGGADPGAETGGGSGV